jgi:hypothetical protein
LSNDPKAQRRETGIAFLVTVQSVKSQSKEKSLLFSFEPSATASVPKKKQRFSLRSILEQAGLSREEFLSYLD